MAGASSSSTSSTSQSLIRKSTDTDLMPPPPPPKRIKRPPIVLDEDTYTDALSEIIARDFFPGLLEAKHQQEYLDALTSNDPDWIRDAERKLSEVMTPNFRDRMRRRSAAGIRRGGTGFTPMSAWGGTPMSRFEDTPLGGSRVGTPGSVVSVGTTTTTTTTGGGAGKGKVVVVDTSLSLDAFQAKYTSEDNASFNDLLDKQNQKRRNAYAWLWSGNNKIPGNRVRLANRLLKERAEKEGASSSARGEGNVEGEGEGEGQRKSIGWIDDRKAAPETWKSRPRNDFMFIPEGVDDDHHPQPKEVDQQTPSEKPLPPKSISYANTRLPPPLASSSSSSSSSIPPPSPSLTAIQDAIAGNPRLSTAAPSIIDDGSATPRINGYAFVDDEPTPSEIAGAELLERERSESLSYLGNLALPPSPSSSSAAAPGPFKILPTPRRELLLNKMVDKVAKNKRPTSSLLDQVSSSSSPKGATPMTPRFASARRLMTPAAQRLWSTVSGTPAAAGRGFSGEVFDKGKVRLGASSSGPSGGKTPLGTPRRKV